MDPSDDSEEITFWYEGFQENSSYVPDCMPTPELHRATLEGDLPNVRRLIELGESVNKREPTCNYSPLHMAIIYNNLEILDYLLSKEGVEVDARSCEGKTPLHLAVSFRRIKPIQKLIEAGCDVNITDNYDDSALHLSVYYPDVPYFPIQDGTNNSRDRVMSEVLDSYNLEIIYILLYYNVDVNILDGNDCTPFMYALAQGHDEVQQVLFEYVDDFNRFTNDPAEHGVTMSFALQNDSPLIKDMIERGADVNYGDDPRIKNENCAFSWCLQYDALDLSTFKIVWERLRYNDLKKTIDLLLLFDRHKVVIVPTFLQVIIESDNFEIAVQFFSNGENYFLFVNKFAEGKFDLEQLTDLTCRLLERGFQASSYDVYAVFSHYGYCELFRILLYMDNDLSRGWLPHMALSRLIFDVDYDLKSIVTQVKDIPKNTTLRLLEYSVCPPLIDALNLRYSEDENMSSILRTLPRVPSLVELARNPARKQIWQSFKITNTCQFYTRIDYLDIPTFYKEVLTFKRKTYVLK